MQLLVCNALEEVKQKSNWYVKRYLHKKHLFLIEDREARS